MFDERAQGPKGRGELVSLLLNFFFEILFRFAVMDVIFDVLMRTKMMEMNNRIFKIQIEANNGLEE